MAQSRITNLLDDQARALDAMQDADAARTLRALNDARRALREQMEALRATGGDRVQRFTAQHLRVMQAQVDAGISQLTRRLTSEMDSAGSALGRLAANNLLQVIRANEPEFTDTGNRIEYRVLVRLNQEQGLLLHRYSVQTYGQTLIASIQREMAAGVARGLSIPQMTDRITATDRSVFGVLRGRAELIARMESNNAYNGMHHAALEEAAAILDDPGTDDPLRRQANEYMDGRTTPISHAIDGMVADINKPWKVPVARVQASASALKKPVGGVLWPIVGGFYVVGNYPVHFGERGREVPFRASWGGMPQPPE